MTYATKSEALRRQLEGAVTALQARRPEEAARACREALSLAADNGDALHLLGVALLELGQAEEALPYLERGAHKLRQSAQAVANLGHGYLALRRHKEAAASFRKAARLEPSQAQFHVGIAAALALDGNVREAGDLLDRLTSRFPDSALVWLNLGHVMRDEHRLDQALECYRKAVSLEAQLADAHNNVGRMLHMTSRLKEAEEAYRNCLAIAPDYLPALFNLASVLIDRGDAPSAQNVCREIIAREPQAADAYRVLGAALAQEGKLLDARAAHERTLELAPGDRAIENYAIALLETGAAGEGLRRFARHLRNGNASLGSRQVLGTWLLADGQMLDGWREYLLRPGALRLREKYARLPVSQTLPEDVRGRHLCVMREQGLGDEIFFLRYLNRLVERGARVTYRAHPKIAVMLERSNMTAAIVPESDDVPPADIYILVGDLPYALDALPASETSFDAPALPMRDFGRAITAYWPPVPGCISLKPDAMRLKELRARLAALGEPPYVGVTWRAGTRPEEQGADWVLHKEIALPRLANTLHGSRATLIALQRHPARGEVDELARLVGKPVHDLTAINEDLEDMLALLTLLDDYVAVSNTNVHLRAAVGKTARVLVPVPAEWRWMQFGKQSPWFPGFSLYRQSLSGSWDAATAELRSDLQIAYADGA